MNEKIILLPFEMKTSLPAANSDQSRRIAIIKEHIGCVACRKKDLRNQADGHHMTSGGIRIDHHHLYGLCEWHHRGHPPMGWSIYMAEAMLGPSLIDGSKAFHDEFGTDEELLEYTNHLVSTYESTIIGARM